MPTLSCAAASVAPETEAIVFVSKLPLRSRVALPGFMRDTMRIKRQLDALHDADSGDDGGGLLWYALRADLAANVYWTVSAWRSNDAMVAFVRADPHAQIMSARRGQLGGFDSARWTVTASELPIDHDEVVVRIAAAD